MRSCTQLAENEALVLGELDAREAADHRAHLESCGACRAELALVIAERQLFARRAEVMSEPPAAVATAVRRQLDSGSLLHLPLPRSLRLASGVGHLLRRGHVSVACAAALFVVAAFSRVGNPAGSSVADDESGASGILASFHAGADEPLACSLGAAPMSHDDGAMSSSSVLAASRSEVLACRPTTEGARMSASCEPFVTCSSFRQ